MKSLRFPVTQTDSVLEERVRMKRLLGVILSPNEERVIKPVYSGIFLPRALEGVAEELTVVRMVAELASQPSLVGKSQGLG